MIWLALTAQHHDPIYVEAYYLAAILASVTGVGIASATAYRRHDRTKTHKIDAIERERAHQLAEQAEMVRKLTEAILGMPASLERPFPEPGLLEQMAGLRSDVAEVKKEVTPNGLDSNRLGDRVGRLERDFAAYHSRETA